MHPFTFSAHPQPASVSNVIILGSSMSLQCDAFANTIHNCRVVFTLWLLFLLVPLTLFSLELVIVMVCHLLDLLWGILFAMFSSIHFLISPPAQLCKSPIYNNFKQVWYTILSVHLLGDISPWVSISNLNWLLSGLLHGCHLPGPLPYAEDALLLL